MIIFSGVNKNSCYGKVFKARRGQVEKSMQEMHDATLKSGKSGKPVKSRKQAIVVGLSEARKEGAKVPKISGSSAPKKQSSSGRSASRSKAG